MSKARATNIGIGEWEILRPDLTEEGREPDRSPR